MIVIVTGSGQLDPGVGPPGKPLVGKSILDIPLGNTPGTILEEPPGVSLEASSGILDGEPLGTPSGILVGDPSDESLGELSCGPLGTP